MQGTFSKNIVLSLKQKTRDKSRRLGTWVGVFEQEIVGIRRSESEMCESRIPGTWWVVGRED